MQNHQYPRPTEPQEVPRDDQGRFLYTPEQIERYRSVLFYETIRRHPGFPDGNKRQEEMDFTSILAMAGGRSGKSALLNRIASGLWPFVLPPPVVMSHPWYEVVESSKPIELWLDFGDVASAIAHEKQYSLTESKGDRIIIEQSAWNVFQEIDETSVHVTRPAWEALGFVWKLSRDKILASHADQFMLSWHDHAIARITTMDQLVKEIAWHVNKRVDNMRIALDPILTELAMAEAKEKDGGASKFNEISTRQRLECLSELSRSRVLEGKKPVPDEAEVEAMIQQDVENAFKGKGGSGAYSADANGMLWVQTWRIRRIFPKVLPDSVYLDVEQLSRAPESLKL